MESTIAKNVKKIIKEKGFKQYVIAERAGFNPKTFSNMLNGRKIIADYDVSKITNALGVTPNDIFGFNNEQKTA
jgi:transcriptional regulator with XRE-family HTH domain